jgi:hypothetical protein
LRSVVDITNQDSDVNSQIHGYDRRFTDTKYGTWKDIPALTKRGAGIDSYNGLLETEAGEVPDADDLDFMSGLGDFS